MSDDRLALACGVRLDDLTRQVFDGVAPGDANHQRACRHCDAALDHIRALAAEMNRAASTPVVVPPGLLRRVMARLRAAPALLTVTVGERGITEVGTGVVARIARDAAIAVTGVEFASALPSERASSAMPGLRVRLVVSYGPSLPALAESVRDAVRHATARHTGVRLDRIDVSIDDLV